MKSKSVKEMLEIIDGFSQYFDSLDCDLNPIDEIERTYKFNEIEKLKEQLKNIEQFKPLVKDLNDSRFLNECEGFSYWFTESLSDMAISWDNLEEERTIDYLKETAKNNDLSFEMVGKLLRNATFFQDVDGVMYYDDKAFQKSLNEQRKF